MIDKWQPGATYIPGALVQPRTALPATVPQPSNAGFESGNLTGWTPADASRWAVLTGDAYSGTYFARASGAGLTSMVSDTRAPVRPGLNVTVQARAKITNHGHNDAGAQVVLNWYDSNGNATGTPKPGTLIYGKGGVWKSTVVSDVAPANAASFAVSLSVNNGNHGSTVEWDGASYTYATSTVTRGLVFRATQESPGKSGATEPAWPSTTGIEVTDNEVTWEGIIATRLVWKAIPLMKSGPTEPVWPAVVGGQVHDGTIDWIAASQVIADPNCPHSKIVQIAAGKVYAADDDRIPYSATANPKDWSSTNNAGFLPFGLQTYGANPVAAMGLYRGNLVPFNSQGMQTWQVDTDPQNTTNLDGLPIACTRNKSLAPVSNDLLFLSSQGVRSLGLSAASTNLQAGDVGMPIDVLVRAKMKAGGPEPIATYLPELGQYWLAFPPPRPELSGTTPDTCNDAAYSMELAISQGVAPYSAPTVYQGAAPAGTTFTISGDVLTIAFANADAGDYDFFVTVTDASGRVSLPFECKFRVHDFAILGTLSDGVTGAAYSQALLLDDGVAPYGEPQVLSGALPAGATLAVDGNQLVVAWPADTAVAVYDFELGITDATGCQAASAQSVRVDLQGAQLSDWRYLQIARDDATDYSAAEFDDSAWAVGTAPFGSWEAGWGPGQVPAGAPDGLLAAHSYDPRFASDFATPWETNTRLWLRRTLTLAAVPAGDLLVTCYIEDHCVFYINGTAVITTPADHDGGIGQQFTISPDKLVVGANIIAIRCDDEAPNPSISVVYADFLMEAT